MLWAAPLAVFAAAQLWSYTGRGILHVGPESSLVDRTMAATKLAGAALGAELIGIKVVNVTMSSYGQRTINSPSDEVQIPTIEPSLSSDLASNADTGATSSGRAFDLSEMLYGYFVSFLSFRPHVAWFTVYPEIMLALVTVALIRLTWRLTGFYRGLRFVNQSLRYAFDQLWHLTQTITTFGRLAEQATESMEQSRYTIEVMQEDNQMFREVVWKYMGEIKEKMLEMQEWQMHNQQHTTDTLARLEWTMRAIGERSQMPNTEWERYLTLNNVNRQLANAYNTMYHWYEVLEREQAKIPDTFANDLVHDANYILTVVSTVIESTQTLLLKQESLATQAQPDQGDRTAGQDLSSLRGPPRYHAYEPSPRTLDTLERRDPTKAEIEAEHAAERMEMPKFTPEDRQRESPENEKKEEGLEMTRIAIEKREREQKEKEEKERTRKAIAEIEHEKEKTAKMVLEELERERIMWERLEKERRESERIVTEPEENKPKEDEPKEDVTKEIDSKEIESKEDEAKEDVPKEIEFKEDEPKEIESKEDEAKEDEPKGDEPKEDEPKETESKEFEPKKGAKTKKGTKPKKPQSE